MKSALIKGIALIMVLCTILCIAPTYTYANVSEDNRGIELLKDLEIVSDDFAKSFKPERRMKRRDFAKIMCGVLNYYQFSGMVNKNNKVFSDVSVNDEDLTSILLSEKFGIMSGDGNGKFRPDEEVTYEQAVKVVMSALGYDDIAAYYGGYPSGYLILASQNGVLKGVKSNSEGKILSEDIIKIIVNALNIRVMQYTAVSGENITLSADSNETLINVYHNIYVYSGICYGVPGKTAKDISPLKENEIYIGDKRLKTKTGRDFEDSFGKVVDYYQADDETVLAVSDIRYANKIYKISGENVEFISDSSITYVVGETKQQKSFDLNTDIIYNGRLLKESLNKNDFIKDSSVIEIFDAYGNGSNEILSVTTITNYVVDKYDRKAKKVYDIYNSNHVFNIDDYKDYIFKNDFNDTMDFESLNKYDVISVAASRDKSYAFIKLSNKEISGTVSEIGDSGNEFKVNGESFKIADNFKETARKISVGREGVFVVDASGRIAAYKDFSDSYKYGYLIGAGTESALGGNAMVKLLTYDGKVKTYYSDKLIKLEGRYVEFAKYLQNLEANNEKINSQVIRYYVANDKIMSIDTIEKGEGNDDDKLCIVYRCIEDDGTEISSIKWSGSQMIFGQKIATAAGAKLFSVPNDNSSNDDDYAVSSLAALVHGGDVFINAYSDTEGVIADAVVRYSGASSASPGSTEPISLVSGVKIISDGDGETHYRISVIRENRYEEYDVAKNVIVDELKSNKDTGKVHKLQAGDLVRLAFDGLTKQIIGIELRYEFDVDHLKENAGLFTNNDHKTVGANVYENIDGYVRITKEDLSDGGIVLNESKTEMINGNLHKIYKFVPNSRGQYSAEIGSISDVYDYVNNGENYSKIVLYARWADPGVIIIYK